MTRFNIIHDKLIVNPKRVFLIDSLGAFLTAILLITMLAQFENYFGMPQRVVYFLSLVACLYAIYSICCYFFADSNWILYLKIIMIANLAYGLLTISFVIFYFQQLTIIGLIYFIVELIVMAVLILVESRTITASRSDKF